MKKITLVDYKSNRTKTKKPWLGLLSFCMLLLVGQMSFAQTTGTIQIGSGTETTSGGAAIPISNYVYNYNQQIITAAEYASGGGAPGNITKIRYKATAIGTLSVWNDWTVYIGHTTKTEFASTTDWVPLSDLTQIFSGIITPDPVADNWFEITFTTPFNYTGGNIVVAIDENTPGWTSAPTFAAYTSTANKGIYYRSDSTNPDPVSPPEATGRVSLVAQIQFEGTLASCLPPTNLVANNITATSAELGWTQTGTATTWDIEWGVEDFSPTGTPNISGTTTNPHTLSGLTELTNYDFYVRSNCGPGDLSLWVGPYTFQTDCSAQLAGTYSIGATGDYATITEAVTALNVCGVSAAVTFLLIDATYPSETFPITVNVTSSNVPTASMPVTFRPDTGVNAVISGTSTSSIFAINGTSHIYIDGSNSGGTDRSLTIENTSTSANTAAIQLISQGAGMGATNNTITNCNIMTGEIGTTTSLHTFGIYIGGASISNFGTGSDNDNNTISNNIIKKARYGIYARGASVAAANDNLMIIDNEIGSNNPAEYVTFRGIDITNADGAIINGNYIHDMKINLSASNAGIDFGTGVSNSEISGNTITGIYSESTNGYGAYGINFSSTSNVTNNSIINNAISDIQAVNYSSASTTFNAFGIRLSGGTNTKVYYNSVNLFGNITIVSGTPTQPNSAALIVTATAVTGLEVVNNVLVNTQSFVSGSPKTYSIWVPASYTGFSIINNNDYYGTTTTPTTYHVGRAGAVDHTLLSNWAGFTTQDVNSISANPLFYSLTDLIPILGSPVIGAGTPMPSVTTTDIIGATRSGTAPSMGAYENGQAPPSCPQPTDLAATNITSTSADLIWTENGTASIWDIEWGALGFTPTGTPNVSGVTSTTYTLSGLNSNTSYHFYVRSDCGGGDLSPWAGPFSFTTSCAVQTVPTSMEDFADANFNFNTNINMACWSEGTGILTASTTVTVADGGWGALNYNNDATHPNGNAAYINLYSFSGSTDWLISHSIDLDSAIEPELRFDVSVIPWSGTSPVTTMGDHYVQVVVSTDDGATWSDLNVVQTYDNTNIPDAGIYEQIDLSAYSGVVKIGFYAYQDGTAVDLRFYIDNFEVVETFVCDAPTALTIVAVTDNTAQISWTSSATETGGYNWLLMADGDDPLTDLPVNSGSVATGITSVGLTGLDDDTTYDFYVQTECGGGESTWAGPLNFTTDAFVCDAPTALTIIAITDTTAEISWTASATETAGYSWEVYNTGANPDTDTPFVAGTVGTGMTMALVNGLIAETTYDFYVATVCVGSVESSKAGPVTFTTAAMPCDAPTALTQVNVDFSSFEASWTASATETGGYNWVVMADGDNPLTDTPLFTGSIGTGNTNVTVTGLSASTDYDFYVQTLCSGGVESNWQGPLNITTEAAFVCDMPSNIAAGTITESSAELSWTASPSDSDGYLWIVFLAGEDPNTATSVADGSVSTGITQVNISGLDEDTAYDFYVRTNCGMDGVSDWLGPFTFVTDFLGTDDNVIDGFAFYPNPMQDVVNVRANNNIDSIVIFSLVGQKLVDLKVGATTSQIDVSNFASGPYLMQVTSNGKTGIYRLIKE